MLEMRFLLNNGECRVVKKDDPDFGGFLVSIGVLGVMSTVTLQCIPRYNVKGETLHLTFEEL